ncbi:cyclophilin-like fold protein [Butyrivibrio sp. INlla14]|uniref:cyclophilin-like fold protein n=1 Tax=Butyrivibrio sp. INlla14 TaxID=1520808 RepID=UPI0008760473|nr:cyclophilin-like fold protein [Butyrivibrio sp. INlla14]SCY56090.1 hypothetical protein SAMN02910371_02768 [Butyrivibrio sp. INlla14]
MSLEKIFYKKKCRAWIILCLLVVFTVTGCRKPVNTESVSEAVSIPNKDNEEMTQARPELEEARNIDTATMESSKSEESMTDSEERLVENTLKLFINDEEIPVTWEENESVKAVNNLAESSPIIIDMSMYGGFEQVGSIGQSIPRNDKQMTTSAGDIVLYSGNQLVVFYGSNSWAYTKLGHIDNKSEEELGRLLGSGNVTITVSVNE